MWNTQQCLDPHPLKHSVTTLHSNIPVQPPFLTDNRQQWTAMLLEHLTTGWGIDINTIDTHCIAQALASNDALPSEHCGTNPAGSGAVPGSQNENPKGKHLTDRCYCLLHLHAVGTVTGVEAMVLVLLAIPPLD